MNAIRQYKITRFFIALLASILGVAAIPGIPIFASKGLWFLMAICIAFVADLVYGVPFFWIAYANAGAMYRTVYAVRVEGLEQITDIAAYICQPEKQARYLVQKTFNRGFLDGYLFDGTRINKIVKKKALPTHCKCPYCLSIYEDILAICPRCGATPEPIISPGTFSENE